MSYRVTVTEEYNANGQPKRIELVSTLFTNKEWIEDREDLEGRIINIVADAIRNNEGP